MKAKSGLRKNKNPFFKPLAAMFRGFFYIQTTQYF